MLRTVPLVLVTMLSAGCSNENLYDHDFSIEASQWYLANQQADLGVLRDSAIAIESWHTQFQTGSSLNDALTDQAYPGLASEFPCSLPRELEALWKWKNGESTDYFVWYHGFLSLQEALAQYRFLLSEPQFGWRPDWIPVFQFQDEWNFVVCSDEPTAGSPVIHYFTEDGPSYAYTNLTTYLQTAAVAMERGALTWTDGWWSNADDVGKLAAIHAEYNELAKFPYAVD